MKKKFLFITQSIEEIDFFLKSQKFKKEILIIPIELEALLYCDIHKLNYINPKKFISKNFQKKTIIESARYF